MARSPRNHPARRSNNNQQHPHSSPTNTNSSRNTGERRGPQHQEQDFFHNADHPSCRLLHEIALEVFGTNLNLKKNLFSQEPQQQQQQPSLLSLSDLVLQQILTQKEDGRDDAQQRQQQEPEPDSCTTKASTKSPKKKRKKKKKKKGKQKEEGASSNIAASSSVDDEEEEEEYEDAVAEAVAEAEVVAETEQVLAQDASSLVLQAQAQPLTTRIGTEPQQQTPSHLILHPKDEAYTCNPHWALLQDFLHNQQPHHQQQPQQSPFWNRLCDTSASVLSSNTRNSTTKNSAFSVAADTVEPWIRRIACPACRQEVEAVLQIETKLVLLPLSKSNTTNTSSSTSAADCTDTEHAFDYVAMEEGIAPPPEKKKKKRPAHEEEEQYWAFELNTAGTDKNRFIVWQLQCHKRHRDGLDSDSDDDSDRNNNNLLPSTMTLQDLSSRIFYDYILGRGLSYEDMFQITAAANADTTGQDATTPNNTTTVLSDDIVSSIRETVDSECERLDTEFSSMMRELERHGRKFKDIEFNANSNYYAGVAGHDTATTTTTTSTIDMSAFSDMQQVDEGCCAVLEQLLSVLIKTTASFFTGAITTTPDNDCCFGVWPRSVQADQLPLHQTMFKMWKMYWKGVARLCNAIAVYEEGRNSQADAQGSLPAVFFSTTIRSHYQRLVTAKLQGTVCLVHSIRECLDTPVETGLPTTPKSSSDYYDDSSHHGGFRQNNSTVTTFYRKLLTQQAYHQVLLRVCQQEMQPEPVDTACQDFLSAARECVETVTRGNLRQVNEEHRLRRERMLRRLGVAMDRMEEMVNDIIVAPSAATDQSDKNVNLMEQLVLLGDHVVPMLKMEHSEGPFYFELLSDGVFQLVGFWIDLRYQYKATVSKAETKTNPTTQLPSPLMPDKLLRSMVRSSPQYNNHQLDVDHENRSTTFCHGGGNGKERAICILVGLFYRWMCEVWEEWRAEIAEQELLTSMEQDSEQQQQQRAAELGAAVEATAASASVGKGGTKQGKKHKKKKDKKTDASGVNQSSDLKTEAVTPENGSSANQKFESTEPDTKASASLANCVSETTTTDAKGTIESSDSAGPEKADASDGKRDGDERLRDEPRNVTPEAMEVVSVKNGQGEEHPAAANGKDSRESPAGDLSADDMDIDIDSFLTIGVYDQSGFISAEEFLVGRLIAVLKETNN